MQALRMEPESADQLASRQLIKAFKDEMRHAGSCQNYLNKMLAPHGKQDEFHAALARMVPRSSAHKYLTTTPFPVWDGSEPLKNVFILHVSDFDFHPTASLSNGLSSLILIKWLQGQSKPTFLWTGMKWRAS